MDHIFWNYSGIVFWTLLGLWAILRFLLGKQWWLKIGGRVIVGGGLMNASKKLASEANNNQLQQDTIVEVGVHLLWRLTRVGIIALVIALIPFLLLYQQNTLIKGQNKLIERQAFQDSLQTDLLLSQNALFEEQNEKVDRQIMLLDTQNVLFKSQNFLFEDQNTKVSTQTDLLELQTDLSKEQNLRLDTQNYRLNLQNNLIEAERRGSLVILMSDVMNQMNAEINRQKEKKTFNDSLGYSLSDPLIGRIGALSEGFLPYRFLEGDTLTKKEFSPERGQLLQALINSKLDSVTLNKIYRISNFNNAYLVRVNLSGANLSKAKLSNAGLSWANLSNADLSWANLGNADLSWAYLHSANLLNAYLTDADLSNVDLSWANLSGANLAAVNFSKADLYQANLSMAHVHQANLSTVRVYKTNFFEVKNLTVSQLIRKKSLYNIQNLDPKIKSKIEKEKPCLFTREGCDQ